VCEVAYDLGNDVGSVLSSAALPRLFVALFFAQSAFALYSASLPVYFDRLGFDPTLIGLLIGSAGVAELVGALGVGPSIDRFGGRVVLLLGLAAYFLSSVGYTLTALLPALFVLRLLQGFGLAAVMPAAYSFVPHLVRPHRETLAFASLGAANSLAGAIFPVVGLLLLDGSPDLLFLAASGAAVLGVMVVSSVPAAPIGGRALGLTFRAAWLAPLLVTMLALPQWGVINAFMPLEATRVGSNPALLFTADAISVLSVRLPAGWIADRYGPLRLALVGVISMSLSPAVLLLPMSDLVLIVAGMLNGVGAGLSLPPLMAQLSQRSDNANRGTALALYAAAFAIGMIGGSSVGGLLYSGLGYAGLLRAGAVLCSLGVPILLADAFARSTRMVGSRQTSA
jgi:MFS family permease